MPARAGVYYFLDAHGQVDLRWQGHQYQKKNCWSLHWRCTRVEIALNIRNEIHHIAFELTGNELIALIFESQEIRRLWPKYNLAQKYRTEEWGIYDYEDRNTDICDFCVNTVSKGAHPLITFSSKGDAWNFWWEKVKEFELCPKLSGLQVAKGPCFSYQSGTCGGACQEIESVKKYNKRAQKAIHSFFEQGNTLAIIGQGRKATEQSLVLVENGNYVGFGFFDKQEKIGDVETAKNFVKTGKENRTVQNLVNSFLVNPRGAGSAIVFE